MERLHMRIFAIKIQIKSLTLKSLTLSMFFDIFIAVLTKVKHPNITKTKFKCYTINDEILKYCSGLSITSVRVTYNIFAHSENKRISFYRIHFREK